jgi:tripartite-type tricarboxylate transporter receptor subunit TctC
MMRPTHAARTLRALAMTLLFACAGGTHAQGAAANYPNKPVKIIVGYGAGGTGDVTMRILAQKLSDRLGQQFVIENRPSAGGLVASQLVAQSAPDGYTLVFIATGNFAMTPGLFKSLPFDPVKDFEMISLAGNFGFALITRADSKIGSVKDLITQARASPGKINIGTVAVGTAQYLAAEYFKSAAGINAITVPFKTSGDVVSAVRAGEIDVGVETLAPVIAHIQSGAVRALAVTDPQRFPALPNVPTVQEAGVPGYSVSGWNGLAAPARTPREIIDKLNREIQQALAAPDLQKKYVDLGIVPKGNTPEEMFTLLKKDIALWKDVIEKAKLEKQ